MWYLQQWHTVKCAMTSTVKAAVEFEQFSLRHMLEHHEVHSLQKDDAKECVMMVASCIFGLLSVRCFCLRRLLVQHLHS